VDLAPWFALRWPDELAGIQRMVATHPSRRDLSTLKEALPALAQIGPFRIDIDDRRFDVYMTDVLRRPMTMVAHLDYKLELPDGSRWFEIGSTNDAETAGILSHTAIKHRYSNERDIEQGHPRRWFGLLEPSDGRPRVPVTVSVTPPEVTIRARDEAACVVNGYAGTCPYPDYTTQIDALASHIGIAIPQNHHGRPLEQVPATAPGL
jgi:hypothetical protein